MGFLFCFGFEEFGLGVVGFCLVRVFGLLEVGIGWCFCLVLGRRFYFGEF